MRVKQASLDGLVQSKLIDFMSAFMEMLSAICAPCQNISVRTTHTPQGTTSTVAWSKRSPTTVRKKLGDLRQGKQSAAEFAEEVRHLAIYYYKTNFLLMPF